MPGSLVDRTNTTDEAWAERLEELGGYLPDENRSFRRLYPLVYRNGSRFTHPSPHVVDALISGTPPNLSVSGGLAAVRARLDLFGVVALAIAVGLAGGITRDLLIGVPPATFRDWRYLAVAAGAGLVTSAVVFS
jgi:hypothetical protein